MKYIITNGTGLGKSTDRKIREAFRFYGSKYKSLSGEWEGFGNPEFTVIETNEDIESPVMESLAHDTKVTQL